LVRLGAFLGFSLVLAALLACGPPGPNSRGALAPNGYKNELYDYIVKPRSDGTFVTKSWIVDNFHGKAWDEEKEKGIYQTTYELDGDGDGSYEMKSTQLTYDLRFEHRRRDGVIWLRTLPIGRVDYEKDLRVLMQRYVDALVGGNYESTGFGKAHERRYAAEVIQKGRARWADMKAYYAIIDLANLDQIKVNPESRETRLYVAMGRTPFSYKPSSEEVTKTTSSFPVLMVAGYANLPEDFDKDLADFKDLLGRVTVRSHAGYEETGRKEAEPTSADERPTPDQEKDAAPPAKTAPDAAAPDAAAPDAAAPDAAPPDAAPQTHAFPP
jgi:hypothetical protein